MVEEEGRRTEGRGSAGPPMQPLPPPPLPPLLSNSFVLLPPLSPSLAHSLTACCSSYYASSAYAFVAAWQASRASEVSVVTTSVSPVPSCPSSLVASRGVSATDSACDTACCMVPCNTTALFRYVCRRTQKVLGLPSIQYVCATRQTRSPVHRGGAKQQAAHSSIPPSLSRTLNERRLSGKWAELFDLDLCERKGAKTGLVIIFSLSLPPQSVRLRHSSFSFSPSPLNGCNDLSKKELLLLLFNGSRPPLLDSPGFLLPSSLPHSLTRSPDFH